MENYPNQNLPTDSGDEAEIKGRLPHGEFTDWVAANLQFSLRSAQHYVRVAENWEKIEAKRAEIPEMSLRNALGYVAESKVDERSKAQRAALLDENSLHMSKVLDEETGFSMDRLVARVHECPALCDESGEFDNELLETPMPLPADGEMLIGQMSEREFVLIERHPRDSRYLRIAAIVGQELIDHGRGVIAEAAAMVLKVVGVDHRTLTWLDVREASAESNPFIDLLPDWKYPQSAAAA